MICVPCLTVRQITFSEDSASFLSLAGKLHDQRLYSGFHMLEEKSNQRSPCWERGPICPPDSHSSAICCKDLLELMIEHTDECNELP